MSLATKYRPKEWEDMVEQSLTVQILKSICEAKEISNRNFLLTGPAGCGKTSLSRMMGNKLNNGEGEIIELDAASNSGADSMRDIVAQAKTYPLVGKYKILIIDECFAGTTPVNTPNGYVPIKELSEGDSIYNFAGETTIKRVFTNHVPASHLVKLVCSGKPIITTQDHLFFTDDGWVSAKNLKVGETLYDFKDLHSMWKDFQGIPFGQADVMWSGLWGSIESAESEKVSSELCENWIHQNMPDLQPGILYDEIHKCYNLFRKVWRRMEEATRTFTKAERAFIFTQVRIDLSDLWKESVFSIKQTKEDLFPGMCERLGEATPSQKTDSAAEALLLCRMWQRVSGKIRIAEDLQQRLLPCMAKYSSERKTKSQIICVDETSQPDVYSGCLRESSCDQRDAREFASAYCESWREWFLHETSTSTEGKLGGILDSGIPDTDKCPKDKSDAVSYFIQSRPRITRYKAGSRGGWSEPCWETSAVAGRKERCLSDKFRVESIEIYQPGSNDSDFQSYFDSSELDSGIVTMYDLEVDGHNSYFVDDVLVHNCHALSPQAWAVMLKTLEEGPARTCFFLCTTNPEKIPKTITSRVQQFQLSKISLSGITSRIKAVINMENAEGANIKYDDTGVGFLAKLANGGMRDALTLLDKVLIYSKEVTSTTVSEALGLSNYDDYFALLSAIAKRDNESITQTVDQVYNSGKNFIKWFEDFHSFVMNIVKYIMLHDINRTTIPAHYEDKLSKYNIKHFNVCLKLANILLQINQDLRSTNYLQEVVLTRLCTVTK